MYRTHVTPDGAVFNNPREYRDYLISQGYKDLGWQNGWNAVERYDWNDYKHQAYILNYSIEDVQWNRSGSDCTYVIHALKVFCSVDMGD